VLLIHCENNGFADGPARVFLRFVQKSLAHEPVARWGENLAFQVLNLEVFILLVDHDCPTAFRESLGGNVRA